MIKLVVDNLVLGLTVSGALKNRFQFTARHEIHSYIFMAISNYIIMGVGVGNIPKVTIISILKNEQKEKRLYKSPTLTLSCSINIFIYRSNCVRVKRPNTWNLRTLDCRQIKKTHKQHEFMCSSIEVIECINIRW